MTDLLGLAYLGLFGFTIWMWGDALNRPGAAWTATTWTKKRWFVTWYLTGVVTFGLAPMGMAIYYYRTLRPLLRAANATTPRERPDPSGPDVPVVTTALAGDPPSTLPPQASVTTSPNTVEAASDTFLARGRPNGIASAGAPNPRPSLMPVAVLLGAALITGAILFARSHSEARTSQDARLVESQLPPSQTTQAPAPPQTTDAAPITAPLSIVTLTPTTTSIGRRAGDEMLAAVNRQAASLNAIPSPPPGSGDVAWSNDYNASAAVFQRFVNDVVAISFPPNAKTDADLVIRDATNLIGTYQRAAAAGLSYEGANQISVAYDTLEGSEQVLGNDLAHDR